MDVHTWSLIEMNSKNYSTGVSPTGRAALEEYLKGKRRHPLQYIILASLVLFLLDLLTWVFSFKTGV